MPCNIGYRSYAKIEIPEPQPQVFKAKADVPEIDADLLAKLGSEDQDFLRWTQTLKVKPLLDEALKRTLAKTGQKGLDIVISDKGVLEAKGSYTGASERKRLTEAAEDLSERWQFEILGIVAQLLDYKVTISQSGGEFTLEGEKGAHPADSLKITKKGRDATFTFEHFKSRGALELETAKFLTLAHRLGVKIALQKSSITEGDPFPGEVLNRDRHRHHHNH